MKRMRRLTLILCVAAFVAVILAIPSSVQMVRIVGGSDAPVLPDGSLALFSLVAYDVRLPNTETILFKRAEQQPGDLILFVSPDGFLTTKHVYSVKGDQIEVRGLDADNSRDSRHYGPISREKVLGRLLWTQVR